MEIVEHLAEEDLEETMELSLSGVNKTALGQLLKKIREEFAALPEEAHGIFQPQQISSTDPPTLAPLRNLTQSSVFCADIIERCDEKPLWNALMGYGFLIVFCFALIGNCLNLLIYKSDHIRFFIAIRMLCTKLLMNTLMMAVMLPQALRVIRLWEIGGQTDQIYWRFWPYQAYLTNVFGFCAMWLTVLMTGECYIHIFFPSKSKLLCTKQTVWRSYFIILLAALVLASIYPLNRDVSLIERCDRKIVKIITSQSPVMIFFEKIHTIADMFLSILLPLSLLVFMTAMIVWRLWIWPRRRWRSLQKGKTQQNGKNQTSATGLLSTAAYHERNKRENHFAAEKRGVTRITLITCFIQLVTETPSMSVLIYVSMFGPNVHKKEHICQWQTISYFLCLCNASLSFFVYITFSNRFRKTMINRARRLLHQLCPSIFPEVSTCSSIGLKHNHRLANSSATPSQMIVLTSKNNSPRNGSQCEGKQQKLLVVSHSEPMGSRNMSRSTTTLKDDSDNDRQSPLSKMSGQNSPTKLEQQSQFPLSLAKRFLQQKLQQSKAKGPLKKLECEKKAIEGKNMKIDAEKSKQLLADSLMTETTNSLETIPPSISGHHLAQKINSIDSNCRPLSNSMNGRITGNGEQQKEQIKRKETVGSSSLMSKEERKQSGIATKRSSVCSTMTNTNSQFDAFL